MDLFFFKIEMLCVVISSFLSVAEQESHRSAGSENHPLLGNAKRELTFNSVL